MGCCGEKEQMPLAEMPQKGTKHAFLVRADSIFSNNFTVFDNTPNADNLIFPWLRLQHSNSLDNDAGTIDISWRGHEDQRPLLTVDVGPMEFRELDASTRTGECTWYNWDQDDNTMLAWEAKRTARFRAEGCGETPSAEVSIKYVGVASCTKDIDRDYDGDREVEWKKWAQTKEVNVTLKLEGKEAALDHNLGTDKGGSNLLDQKYKVEGNFDVQYVDKWGKDEVLVHTEEGGEPLAACAVGFVVAYWLHPKRVEDNAMNKAEAILRSKQGWFDTY